jgi:hypothetical protein
MLDQTSDQQLGTLTNAVTNHVQSKVAERVADLALVMLGTCVILNLTFLHERLDNAYKSIYLSHPRISTFFQR